MPDTDVIRPFTPDEKKYEGPPPTPDNFASAFPELLQRFTGAPKGINPLDKFSSQNLEDLRRQMRSTPPKPATVINLHPWPLAFESTAPFVRGIQIPPCEPGQDFAWHHIRAWSADKKYNEECTGFLFSAILPIHKAMQFYRAFSDPEVYGGGVIIYEGEMSPNKLAEKNAEIETYLPNGLPNLVKQPGFEYDDEGNRNPAIIEVPVKRKFSEVLAEQRALRNSFYAGLVEIGNELANSKEVKARKELLRTPKYKLAAQVLFAEGLIQELPNWNVAGRIEHGQVNVKCVCGNSVDHEAVKCMSCGHILKPFEAYQKGVIEYGHVSMDLMSAEEWEMAAVLKMERDEAKKKAKARAKEVQKDEANT